MKEPWHQNALQLTQFQGCELGTPAYVENAYELLDEPGEWYLDRKAGRLYYWPLAGEKPDAVEAVVAALPQLLRLKLDLLGLLVQSLVAVQGRSRSTAATLSKTGTPCTCVPPLPGVTPATI